tara:strand:- start:2456 stop:3340 length:885 start_codon:yes stop_codon:yes gene_type:complete
LTKHLIDFKDIDNSEAKKLIHFVIKDMQNPINENLSKTVVMKFDEPSTRTKVSFSTASNKLGLYQIDLTKESTSAKKGESLKDELTTLVDLGVDLLVLRTSSDDKKLYENFEEIGIISAGFGKVSHPTQTFVDLSTIISNSEFDYKKPFVFCGDLKHSRVFHSAIELFPKLGIEIGICAPEEFLPENFNTYTIFENINEAIEKSSGLEILRVQKERIDSSENFNLDNFIKNFQLNKEKIDKASERLMILHPMPMNIGIEIDSYAAENFRMQHRKQLSFGISARKIALKYSLGLV